MLLPLILLPFPLLLGDLFDPHYFDEQEVHVQEVVPDGVPNGVPNGVQPESGRVRKPISAKSRRLKNLARKLSLPLLFCMCGCVNKLMN